MKKKQDEWSEMRLSGWLAWVHRLVMFITFPIRKFWQILLAVAVIFIVIIAVPMCYGVRFADIGDWYLQKLPARELADVKEETTASVSRKWEQVKNTIKEIVPNSASPTVSKNKKVENDTPLVAWHVAEFKKAKYEPKKKFAIIKTKEEFSEEIQDRKNAEDEDVKAPQAVLKKAQNIYITAPKDDDEAGTKQKHFAKKIKQQKEKNIELPQEVDDNVKNIAAAKSPEPPYFEGKLTDYYKKVDNTDLAYLRQVEHLHGHADILGPNSIYIQNTFLYLYGIYSNPQKHDTIMAQRYLAALSEGRNVHCDVVAYTVQTQTATALCFVDGIFLNRALTEHNLADNIALK